MSWIHLWNKPMSYFLTDDGYNLMLSTLEIENNMKLTIHENDFSICLSAFIEELTDRVLEKLERNETISETLDATLTTKNLYDSVVGIGGEAIYNRFDNIYVLNLVQSGLEKHLTYVRAEHVKGRENLYLQTIQASRFMVEDVEQVELEF